MEGYRHEVPQMNEVNCETESRRKTTLVCKQSDQIEYNSFLPVQSRPPCPACNNKTAPTSWATQLQAIIEMYNTRRQ